MEEIVMCENICVPYIYTLKGMKVSNKQKVVIKTITLKLHRN